VNNAIPTKVRGHQPHGGIEAATHRPATKATTNGCRARR